MRMRDSKVTESVKIVDGKIIGKKALPSFKQAKAIRTETPKTDPFIEELEGFSLNLRPDVQKSHDTADTQAQAEDRESAETPLPEGVEDAEIDDFRLVEGILIPKNQAYLPEEFRPELLVRHTQEFCPYFTQNDIADYGLFMDYLIQTGIGTRTRYDYTVSLRKWKRELEKLGGDINIDNLNAILKSVSPARGQNLLFALKAYAKYRNFHQDSKLLILLTTSLTLHKPTQAPKQKRTKPTQAVTKEEAAHYKALAKDLCRDGKKEGVWIGLSLLGVPPGNMTSVAFPDKSHVTFIHRRKEKKAKVEQWLHTACQTIDGWRLGRRTVHRGIQKYEMTPMALNQFATQGKK